MNWSGEEIFKTNGGLKMIFRKGEIFNGPGGLALGADLARITDHLGNEILDEEGNPYRVEHVWSNDYDA